MHGELSTTSLRPAELTHTLPKSLEQAGLAIARFRQPFGSCDGRGSAKEGRGRGGHARSTDMGATTGSHGDLQCVSALFLLSSLPLTSFLSADDPALPTSFFPLPATRSDKLVSKFWATFGEEATLRAFVEGTEVAEVAPTTPVEKVEGQQQEPEAVGTAEGAEGATVAA